MNSYLSNPLSAFLSESIIIGEDLQDHMATPHSGSKPNEFHGEEYLDFERYSPPSNDFSGPNRAAQGESASSEDLGPKQVKASTAPVFGSSERDGNIRLGEPEFGSSSFTSASAEPISVDSGFLAGDLASSNPTDQFTPVSFDIVGEDGIAMNSFQTSHFDCHPHYNSLPPSQPPSLPSSQPSSMPASPGRSHPPMAFSHLSQQLAAHQQQHASASGGISQQIPVSQPQSRFGRTQASAASSFNTLQHYSQPSQASLSRHPGLSRANSTTNATGMMPDPNLDLFHEVVPDLFGNGSGFSGFGGSYDLTASAPSTFSNLKVSSSFGPGSLGSTLAAASSYQRSSMASTPLGSYAGPNGFDPGSLGQSNHVPIPAAQLTRSGSQVSLSGSVGSVGRRNSSVSAAGGISKARSLSRSASTTDAAGKSRRNNNNEKLQCTNCSTKNTPLWRRNSEGQPLCNACGLFLKLHGQERPLSLKSDVIKKRNRNANNSNSSRSTQPAETDTSATGSSRRSSTTAAAFPKSKNEKPVLIAPKPFRDNTPALSQGGPSPLSQSGGPSPLPTSGSSVSPNTLSNDTSPASVTSLSNVVSPRHMSITAPSSGANTPAYSDSMHAGQVSMKWGWDNV